MEKKEILKALDALKAEVEKKPEDKVLEKLDEILRAVQAHGYLRFGTCPYPHYPPNWYPNTTITWQGTTGYGIGLSGSLSNVGTPDGVTYTNSDPGATLTLTGGSN